MSSSNKQTAIGHLACAAAYIIFGVNVVVCRDIANEGGLPPIILFSMRAAIAGALFWLVSFFTPKETMPKKDLVKTCAAGILGLFLPQLSFLHAIALTTPVDLSIMSTITPILTMIIAAIFLKEPITWKKVIGVLVSFAGVLWLILQSTTGVGGATETTPLGIMFCFINYLVFALYLGTCRNLIARYSVITTMKWMFLSSFILSLPFSLPLLHSVSFCAIPKHVWWEIGYLIVFSTFIAYYLVPIGQQRIRPTLVSMYGYLQPLIAIAAAIATGMDRLTATKIIAALLVFGGVAIVNRSRAATVPQKNNKTYDT